MVKQPVRVPAMTSGDMYSPNLNQFREVTNKKSYFHLVEALLEAEAICIDFETQSESGGKKGNMEYWHPHSRTVCASFTVEGSETFVVPLSHPQGPWTGKDKTWDADAPWRKLLFNLGKAIQRNENLKWVAHNAKYEVNWHYAMTGQALENQLWWDTQMSDYILDENEEHSLKAKAVRDLGVERWDDVNLKNAEKVSWDSLALYNARDTDYCLRLVYLDKQRFMEEQRLARLFYFLGMPILRTLARIERRGMPLDQQRVAERKAVAEATKEEITEKLMKVATDQFGMDPDDYPTVSFGTKNKFFDAFMELSGLPVVTYTPTGNPSWDANNLETLELQGYEIARDLMDVRKASNKLSKFFIPWTTKLAPDGRLHPTFNAMRVDDKWDDVKGTTTGRLSSSNPNAQQIAKDEKTCFGGEEGWLVVEMDQSQIELRIAAWIFNEENMLSVYRSRAEKLAKGLDPEPSDDLHILMAADINNIPPEEVDGTQRHGGKAGNFGFLYDMGENTYVTYAWKTFKVEVTPDESRKVRRAFFKRWSRLSRGHNRQRTLVLRNGFVRNPIGRKRRLPEIYSSNDYEVGRAERRAINAPVQSMASDLMCLALIEIERQMDPNEFRLIGTVHDSLLAQVRADTMDETLKRAAGIMLDPGTERKFGVKIGVPLEVEAKIGYHWNDPDGETRIYSTIDTSH